MRGCAHGERLKQGRGMRLSKRTEYEEFPLHTGTESVIDSPESAGRVMVSQEAKPQGTGRVSQGSAGMYSKDTALTWNSPAVLKPYSTDNRTQAMMLE